MGLDPTSGSDVKCVRLCSHSFGSHQGCSFKMQKTQSFTKMYIAQSLGVMSERYLITGSCYNLQQEALPKSDSWPLVIALKYIILATAILILILIGSSQPGGGHKSAHPPSHHNFFVIGRIMMKLGKLV